jgi:hypothetical protein
MHIAASWFRASSRLTLEMECRFNVAERSHGAVIEQMQGRERKWPAGRVAKANCPA